eukprot:10668847-Lingulodinium_polyedra.AAC.1
MRPGQGAARLDLRPAAPLWCRPWQGMARRGARARSANACKAAMRLTSSGRPVRRALRSLRVLPDCGP